MDNDNKTTSDKIQSLVDYLLGSDVKQELFIKKFDIDPDLYDEHIHHIVEDFAFQLADLVDVFYNQEILDEENSTFYDSLDF